MLKRKIESVRLAPGAVPMIHIELCGGGGLSFEQAWLEKRIQPSIGDEIEVTHEPNRPVVVRWKGHTLVFAEGVWMEPADPGVVSFMDVLRSVLRDGGPFGDGDLYLLCRHGDGVRVTLILPKDE